MSSQPLLNGQLLTEEDERAILRSKIEQLTQDVANSNRVAKRALEEAAQVRQVVGPIIRKLREALGMQQSETSSDGAPISDAGVSGSVWSKWKSLVSEKQWDIITFLETGPKNAIQVQRATGGRMQTVRNNLSHLKSMGALVKNGDSYALKVD